MESECEEANWGDEDNSASEARRPPKVQPNEFWVPQERTRDAFHVVQGNANLISVVGDDKYVALERYPLYPAAEPIDERGPEKQGSHKRPSEALGIIPENRVWNAKQHDRANTEAADPERWKGELVEPGPAG